MFELKHATQEVDIYRRLIVDWKHLRIDEIENETWPFALKQELRVYERLFDVRDVEVVKNEKDKLRLLSTDEDELED